MIFKINERVGVDNYELEGTIVKIYENEWRADVRFEDGVTRNVKINDIYKI